jgi:hypothetical protein
MIIISYRIHVKTTIANSWTDLEYLDTLQKLYEDLSPLNMWFSVYTIELEQVRNQHYFICKGVFNTCSMKITRTVCVHVSLHVYTYLSVFVCVCCGGWRIQNKR